MRKDITNIIIAVASVMLCASHGFARTATDFFKSAPDSAIRLLPQATRLDMVDYFNFGSTHSSSNAFNGLAMMKAVSDKTMSFQVDKDVTMQLVVLPAKNDTVIALVTTISTPALDSSIEFYDTEWKPLRRPPFAFPAYNAWLTPEGLGDKVKVEMYLPFIPVSASFDPEGNTLLLTNEAPFYLDELDYNGLKPLLVATKVYNVNAGRFIEQK